jgi:hypothetical protein
MNTQLPTEVVEENRQRDDAKRVIRTLIARLENILLGMIAIKGRPQHTSPVPTITALESEIAALKLALAAFDEVDTLQGSLTSANSHLAAYYEVSLHKR